MHRLIYPILLLIAGMLNANAQQDTVMHRIILAGDGGDLKKKMPQQVDWMKLHFRFSSKETIIYLGDNIYPKGLPDSGDKDFRSSKNILDYQIDLVRNKEAQAFIIPGNHDWMQGRTGGWQQVKNQYQYVKSLPLTNVHFLPADGCPGPEVQVINDKLVLVIMDSQWWLHRNERPGTSSDCECKSEDEVVILLKDIVYRHRDKLMIFAAHHPFKTQGKHGGYFTWKQHIFPLTEVNKNLYIPLPVIGSLYPLTRGVFGNIQDVKHPIYKDFISRIDTVLSQHPYCIRTAGHDHTLQLIESYNQYYVVSGALTKSNQVRYREGSKFAAEGPGISVVELMPDGRIWLKFYSPDSTRPLYVTSLRSFQPPDIEKESSAAINLPDSVKAMAATYYDAKGFQNWLLGGNYRQEWSTAVKAPVFNIGTEKGGLKPVQRGGGMQSKSLRLETTDKKQYVLRSIEKFPDKTLPEEFRMTFIKDAIVDGISASYPYAALSVPVLATAAGVPHSNPKLVFVPDDPRLGNYRKDFANGLYIFEEREPGGLKRTYSSAKVFEELEEDNDNRVDQQAVLKARLLDMFMMDFDRHEDQWRWGANEKDKQRSFFPIPRDRDQAFFINEGFLPGIISRPWIQPKFQGFRAKAKNINTFNFNGRYFDRSFLTNLEKENWEKAVDAFIPLMTDEVIEKALLQQPREILEQSAPSIIGTLKERRKYLKEEVLQYYQFLAKEVDVTGSDKRELFVVKRNENGSVQVAVFKLNKEGARTAQLYNRDFDYSETKEIRLWGLGGEDRFEIGGAASKTIMVRIIGGAGKDSIINNASRAAAAKTKLYDLSTEQNFISGSGKWQNKLSSDPAVNQLDRRAYKYNVTLPTATGAYNPDDGVFLGFLVRNTQHGFRKQPHKIVHQFRATFAFATSAYNFRYDLDAVDVIGKADIVATANIKAPNNTSNFFGLGNETEYDKSKGISYYRTRYNIIEGYVMARFNPIEHLSVSAGPLFQLFDIDSSDNVGRIITSGDLNGVEKGTLFNSKAYLGARLQANLDARNNKIIPTRGIYWETYLQTATGTNTNTSSVTQMSTDMSVYISFKVPTDIVIGLRAGAGINFGDYEFYQAQHLGGTENLRGFRKYRFTGDKMFFNNIDLRLRIADFRGYIIPGSFGLVAFHDIGRVWVDGESSSTWHNGYGGGIWVAPAKRYVLNLCYANSKDGGMVFLTLGFQF